MTRRQIAVMSLWLVGCLKQHNPYYCPGLNADNNCTESDAGGPVCSDSAQCRGMTPICDLAGDKHCRGCRAHQECSDSQTCLPNGSCAEAKDVAYVRNPGGTDNLMCGPGSPCATIGTALALGRPYLKLDGMLDEAVEIGRDLTVLAEPGTTVTRTSNLLPGPHNIVTITGTSNVKIFDLAINGSPGTDAGLVLPMGSNPLVTVSHVSMSGNDGKGGAINAESGTINLYRSTISGNMGGGISIVMAQFDIENNFITTNGNAQSTYGGIFLNIKQAAGTHILSFNTIAANTAKLDAAAGAECTLVDPMLMFSNNIIYKNVSSGDPVVGPHCLWSYSDIQLSTGVIDGVGNLNVDPMFVNAGGGNFHLQDRSPVIDVADPNSTLDVDIDGDFRPQNGRRDIGADEHVRP
jgi:hypothetical protein